VTAFFYTQLSANCSRQSLWQSCNQTLYIKYVLRHVHSMETFGNSIRYIPSLGIPSHILLVRAHWDKRTDLFGQYRLLDMFHASLCYSKRYIRLSVLWTSWL
jgi:hypothetical protein